MPHRTKMTRTTQAQLQFYIRFRTEHPQIQRCNSRRANPDVVRQLWEIVSCNLNAMRGPTRTAARWKEIMYQWEHQLRFRERKKKRSSQTSDDGCGLALENIKLEPQLGEIYASAQATTNGDDDGPMEHEDSLPLTVVIHESSSSSPYTAASPSSTSPSVLSNNFAFPAHKPLDIKTSGNIINGTIAAAPNCQPKLTGEAALHVILSKMEAQEKRDERSLQLQEQLLRQNAEMSASFMQMSHVLAKLTDVLSKLNEKL